MRPRDLKKEIKWLVALRLFSPEAPRLYVATWGLTIDGTKAIRFDTKEEAQTEADKSRRMEVMEVDVYGMLEPATEPWTEGGPSA
jgi:hypothetical protein